MKDDLDSGLVARFKHSSRHKGRGNVVLGPVGRGSLSARTGPSAALQRALGMGV